MFFFLIILGYGLIRRWRNGAPTELPVNSVRMDTDLGLPAALVSE
jgi:hypothetical protein